VQRRGGSWRQFFLSPADEGQHRWRRPENTRQLTVLLRLSGAAIRLRICPGPAVLLA
jgi:hypothetical protein